jgi:RNA polymerase sigma-70 factor (ECF subfamily)
MNGAALNSRHVADRALATDDDVASAARAGSHEAFAELYALYSRRLYQTILTITKNPQDADDALQDTFLRAHLAIHKFEGRSKIYSWLTRIAINSALSILRKQRSRGEVLFDHQPDPQLDALYDLNQRQLETLRAIRSLDPQLRAPIRMKMMHGCSVREIGRALNLSESAVKARLYRARRRLSAAHNHSGSKLPLIWSA